MQPGMSPALMRRRRGGGDPFAAYAAGGFTPKLVADYSTDTFATDGAATDFTTQQTHTGASLRTMRDSSGNLVWAPHNLVDYSEDFSNASWEVVSASKSGSELTLTASSSSQVRKNPNLTIAAGEEYTFEIELSSSTDVGEKVGIEITLIGQTTPITEVTLTSTPTVYSVTATITIATDIAFVKVRNGVDSLAKTLTLGSARLYRSDLGGMANNPDRGDSYVPTTSAAVYLPRRQAYIFESAANVGPFMLVEPAATNLDPNSDDLSAWTTSNTTIAKDQTGAGGETNGAHSITASANNGTALEQITAASADHAWGCLMKRVTGTGTVEVTVDGGTTWVDVTSDINSSTFLQVSTGPGISVTNPEFGVRLGTSGDVVAVQVSHLEQTSSYITSPIPTNGATVTRAADALSIAAANLPYDATNMSIAMKGRMTYADLDGTIDPKSKPTQDIPYFYRWKAADTEWIASQAITNAARTGRIATNQNAGGTFDESSEPDPGSLTPGLTVAFNIATRHTSSAIQLAISGSAQSENATVSGLPTLSSTDITLIPTGVGYIEEFLMWDEDIGDTGIEEASA